jgi:hypothetical protein
MNQRQQELIKKLSQIADEAELSGLLGEAGVLKAVCGAMCSGR